MEKSRSALVVLVNDNCYGLGYEYDPVVVILSQQQCTLSLHKAQYMLMTHEQRIDIMQGQHVQYQNAVPAYYPSNCQANYHQQSANIATADSVHDPAWYADSGAISHVTLKLGNISNHTQYHGPHKLVVGSVIPLKTRDCTLKTVDVFIQSEVSVSIDIANCI
ncbi:hypothetical protein ACOSQ4_005431 [Xanthoceras sorbifolium]